MYLAKMTLRLVLFAVLVLFLSYLWQRLFDWENGSNFYYNAVNDNFTLLDLQSEVEKETANQAINPYLTNGMKS